MVGSQKKQQRINQILKRNVLPNDIPFLLIREAFYTFINWRNIDSPLQTTKVLSSAREQLQGNTLIIKAASCFKFLISKFYSFLINRFYA